MAFFNAVILSNSEGSYSSIEQWSQDPSLLLRMTVIIYRELQTRQLQLHTAKVTVG